MRKLGIKKKDIVVPHLDISDLIPFLSLTCLVESDSNAQIQFIAKSKIPLLFSYVNEIKINRIEKKKIKLLPTDHFIMTDSYFPTMFCLKQIFIA